MFILSISFYFIDSVLCDICITELFTLCAMYFVREDKNKDVQEINVWYESTKMGNIAYL